MSRFTGDEFDIAFQQVYHEYPQDVDSVKCKNLLKFLLTNTPEEVSTGISLTLDENKVEMNNCLITIIGNTSIDELKRFIDYVNDSSVTSANILEIMNQQPHHRGIPIFNVCLQMLQNREQGPLPSAPTSSLFASARPPASAHPPASAYPPPSAPFASTLPSAPFASAPFASTPASAYPHASSRPPASAKDKHAAETERIKKWWELREAGKSEEADRLFGANKGKSHDAHGGSRRRRSSHRKRKSYRKSKRVRHTPRKQTRRHRHRRSRHRR
jgi:hypothetical protein